MIMVALVPGVKSLKEQCASVIMSLWLVGAVGTGC